MHAFKTPGWLTAQKGTYSNFFPSCQNPLVCSMVIPHSIRTKERRKTPMSP